MKELIEYIAKSLVDYPDAVEVTENHDDQGLVIELKVASEDMGKVIGKQGKIARAIRTLAKAGGSKQGDKVLVEIVS